MERADASRDYSKREAAEIAGCDERTIHRAIKADQLTARKEPLPGGGEKTLINGQDLNEWLQKRERDRAPKQVSKQPAALTRQPDNDTPTTITPEILEQVVIKLAENQNLLQSGMLHLAEILQGVQRQLPAGPDDKADEKTKRRDRVPLTDRLTVTVTEAAQLSRIPNARRQIKEAIQKKKLKAIKGKRGRHDVYRIMQDDLREWLKSLRG